MIYILAFTMDDELCHQHPFISVPGPYGYISSTSRRDTPSTPTHCQWRVEAISGQNVAISLIDFNPSIGLQACIPLG